MLFHGITLSNIGEKISMFVNNKVLFKSCYYLYICSFCMHSFTFVSVSSTTIYQDLTTTFFIISALGFHSFKCYLLHPHAKHQFRVLQWFLPQFAEPLWCWLISLTLYSTFILSQKKIPFFFHPLLHVSFFLKNIQFFFDPLVQT